MSLLYEAEPFARNSIEPKNSLSIAFYLTLIKDTKFCTHFQTLQLKICIGPCKVSNKINGFTTTLLQTLKIYFIAQVA